jgi:hypothetical protein
MYRVMSPCRSELAREKRQENAFIQTARVIVNAYREQASSYRIRLFAGKKKRCTDQAHRKAVEHTTKCRGEANQSSSARASAVHS